MADPVHFDLPFKFGPGGQSAATVQQDTIDDVVNCVEAALLTEPGFRPEVPTFGVPDQIFDMQPLRLETIINAVHTWEQRADAILSQLGAAQIVPVQTGSNATTVQTMDFYYRWGMSGIKWGQPGFKWGQVRDTAFLSSMIEALSNRVSMIAALRGQITGG